jgi:hypothetical protein
MAQQVTAKICLARYKKINRNSKYYDIFDRENFSYTKALRCICCQVSSSNQQLLRVRTETFEKKLDKQ